jgi:hypothetical protein
VTDVRRRYGIYKVTEVFLTTRWVSPQSPRLALRLPWKKRRSVTNHNRGCAKITQRPQKTHLNWRNPFRVDLMFDDWPQGSSFVATLGFEAQPLRGKIRKRSATKVYYASLRHKITPLEVPCPGQSNLHFSHPGHYFWNIGDTYQFPLDSDASTEVPD